MDREAWRATVHGAIKSQTRLTDEITSDRGEILVEVLLISKLVLFTTKQKVSLLQIRQAHRADGPYHPSPSGFAWKLARSPLW